MTGTAGGAQVALSWTAPTSDGGAAITRYEYRYSAGDAVSASAAWTDVPDGDGDGDLADQRAVTVTGLANGTEYAFEVRAVNAEGSGPAASATATPAAAPGAPAGVTATAGDAQVALSWTPPADDGGAAITGYRYRYSPGGTVSASAPWTDVPDGDGDGDLTDERAVTVTGLANATEYAFEVRAVNGADGGAAASATATPDGMTPVPALPVAATWLLAGLVALLGVKVRGSRGFGRRR